MLHARRSRVTAPQLRRLGGRFAPPGVVDALVGCCDGAQQQGAEALHQRVQEFPGGTVQRKGTPALEGVAREHGAGLQPGPHARVLAVVRRVDGGRQPQRGRVLGGGGTGEFGHAGLEGVEQPVGRTGHGVLPCRRVLGVVDEPVPQLCDRRGRQQATAPCGLGQFGHGEAGYVAESGLGQERSVLPRHLGDDLVGDPVQDGHEGGVVLLGGAQQMPGDGVGVPGGRRDHDPDVGGADQFGGEGAVVAEEGVDVGGVEEGQAGGQGVGRLQPQHPGGVLAGQHQLLGRIVFGHPHAREVGQYAHPAEPVMVLRMADQHRRPGRRPQHARLGHASAHEGVDERRLAGPGGSAHHGQQGCFGLSQAGHQIVVELREQFVAVGTRAWGPRQGQREACGGDTVAQGGECVEQLRPYVQGHHMRRMPNFRGILKHMSMSARRWNTRDGRDYRDTGTVQA